MIVVVLGADGGFVVGIIVGVVAVGGDGDGAIALHVCFHIVSLTLIVIF